MRSIVGAGDRRSIHDIHRNSRFDPGEKIIMATETIASTANDNAATISTPPSRAVLASMFGTIVEWYDFSVYGAASALVFGKIFFSNSSPMAGLLAAYGTFAVGFLARPIGGIFFSYFGDKYGRKPVLIATLVTMGTATTCIGLLPSYASVGFWAPVLLVALRIVQGFGAGGEFAGAILFASEYAPPGRRGLFGSFAPASVMISLLLSAVMFNLFTRLPEQQFLSWGWRVPFLLSIVAVITGYFIRRRVGETPEFLAARDRAKTLRMPVLDILREQPKLVLLAMGVNVIQVMGYVHVVFATSYMNTHLKIPTQTTLLIQMLTFVACGLACLTGGALSDIFGRKPVMIGATVASALYAFPMIWLLDTKQPVLMALAMVIGAFTLFPFFGTQSAFYTEMFDTRFRYSGITLAREVTYAVFGGPLPFVATSLVVQAGGEGWPVSVIMIGMSAISFVSLMLIGRQTPAS
jgi:MHS family shikimate/dehydroshikimate transporter-like MFS transporter